MKTKITWCVIGFILSWVSLTTLRYIRTCPQDYTSWHPASESNLAPDWMMNANATTLGNFNFYSSANATKASAWIHPSSSEFPSVTFQDENSNGCVDNIQVLDSRGRFFSIYDRDGDGEFDSWYYSPEIAADIIFLSDGDMDGQYDYRVGPGDKRTVKINSQWHDLFSRDGSSFVEINGVPIEVKHVDLFWKIAEGEERGTDDPPK